MVGVCNTLVRRDCQSLIWVDDGLDVNFPSIVYCCLLKGTAGCLVVQICSTSCTKRRLDSKPWLSLSFLLTRSRMSMAWVLDTNICAIGDLLIAGVTPSGSIFCCSYQSTSALRSGTSAVRYANIVHKNLHAVVPCGAIPHTKDLFWHCVPKSAICVAIFKALMTGPSGGVAATLAPDMSAKYDARFVSMNAQSTRRSWSGATLNSRAWPVGSHVCGFFNVIGNMSKT